MLIEWYEWRDLVPQKCSITAVFTGGIMSVQVAIIMGSKSDLPVMQAAADILKDLGVSYDVNIVSAHRTPEYMVEFAKNSPKK